MRVDLQKFLFVGANIQRLQFFKEAQNFGLIQFIDSKSVIKDLPQEISKTIAAIKILRTLSPQQQEETDDFARADFISQEIVQLNDEILKLEEKERVTNLEKVRVEPFGDFSRKDIHALEKESNRHIQFFAAKEEAAKRENLPDELLYINTDNAQDYFISICKEPFQYVGFSEINVERTANELKQEIEYIKKEKRERQEDLKQYAKYSQFLHQYLIYQYDSHNLHESEKRVIKPLDNHLFAVSAWIPDNKIEEVKKLADDNSIYIEQVSIDEREVKPTYLENKGLGRIGEDLVNIYDMPSSTDKDPSLWVLGFFTLFFAMIVGDAGYGLIFLLIAAFLKFKKPDLKGFGYRVWKLLLILGAATFIWGIAISSFFGINLSSQNPLRKASLMSYFVEKKAEYHFDKKDDVYEAFLKEVPGVKDTKTGDEFLHVTKVNTHGNVDTPVFNKFTDNILFELALFVGVIHIIFSLLRYVNRNWSAIGWIIFMIGAYLYLPAYLNATSFVNFVFGVPKSFGEDNGIYMMVGGITLATVLSFIQNKFKGILEPMNLIQIFADTMSYLRIYALSLAGAMVSATINEFAAGTIFIVGALLFVLGHMINLALSIMGGVIHGLRLIFIEWYHYSFEGGGKKFNPLRLLEKDNK